MVLRILIQECWTFVIYVIYHTEFMAVFMVFNLLIGPGFILNLVVNF